jgi:hypothetical protein
VTKFNQRRRIIPPRLKSLKAPARLELGKPEEVVLFQAHGWSDASGFLLFAQTEHGVADPLFTNADGPGLGLGLTDHSLQRQCLFYTVQVIYNRQMGIHTGELCGRSNHKSRRDEVYCIHTPKEQTGDPHVAWQPALYLVVLGKASETQS